MQRPLTPAERDLCAAMIAHAAPDPDEPISPADRERWLSMLPDTSVYWQMGSGPCPPLELAYRGELSGRSSHILLKARIADRRRAFVLLSIDEDRPAFFEVLTLGDEAAEMPSPDDLKFS